MIRCMSPLVHPNMYSYFGTVEVCLNLLDLWDSTMGVKSIIHGLLFLFCEPNFDDYLDTDCAVPEGMTNEEFVRTVLSGGTIRSVTFAPNEAWCQWEKAHSQANSTLWRKEPDSSESALLVDETSDKDACLRCVSAETFMSPELEHPPLETFSLAEIALVWHFMASYPHKQEISFFLAESCSNTETQSWKNNFYGQLNQRYLEQDKFDVRQYVYVYPWPLKESQTSWCQGSVRNHSRPNSTECCLICGCFSEQHDNLVSRLSEEARMIRRLRPQSWIFYQTRWPACLAPGMLISESLLNLSWPFAPCRGSSRQLFSEVKHYLEQKPLKTFSQLLLVDSLTLSPTAPLINRIICEPSPENLSETRTFCAEWLSPWHATSACFHSMGLKLQLPGRSVICWLALLSNWIALASRMELYHFSLGYSRPGNTVFSCFRRITEPIATTSLHPACLLNGNTPLFDAWPLWFSSLLTRGMVHFTVRVLETLNSRYFRCVTSSVSGWNPLATGSYKSLFVFTDGDEI
ncbi:unnamed protein product [Calicophoron daubneyi]